MSKKQDIIILGAGLVGSLQAIFLLKRGYRVSIFERRSDPRKAGKTEGRSINLALSTRGWKALDYVGVSDYVREIAIPMTGRIMHDINGNLTSQKYGKEGQAIYSVSRGLLNHRLINKAEELGARTYFDHKCQKVNLKKNVVKVKHNDDFLKFSAGLIIGADGANSALRKSMRSYHKMEFSKTYLSHFYKELEIPASIDNDYVIEPNALHIWPRESFMLIALPNLDRSFTCTLFLSKEGKESFENLNSKWEVLSFFKSNFPDAVPLMPELVHDFFNNPTSKLVTVKCFPWSVEGRAVLMGDASHAIVPFYGQGMNSGFEDCTIFNELLDNKEEGWAQLISSFEESRKPDADAISDLAMQNFVEMRDLVADKEFLLQKKIEARLHKEYPDKWIPLYSRVTFSHQPYSEALMEGRKQEIIMKEIMSNPDIENIWENMSLLPIIEKLSRV